MKLSLRSLLVLVITLFAGADAFARQEANPKLDAALERAARKTVDPVIAKLADGRLTAEEAVLELTGLCTAEPNAGVVRLAHLRIRDLDAAKADELLEPLARRLVELEAKGLEGVVTGLYGDEEILSSLTGLVYQVQIRGAVLLREHLLEATFTMDDERALGVLRPMLVHPRAEGVGRTADLVLRRGDLGDLRRVVELFGEAKDEYEVWEDRAKVLAKEAKKLAKAAEKAKNKTGRRNDAALPALNAQARASHSESTRLLLEANQEALREAMASYVEREKLPRVPPARDSKRKFERWLEKLEKKVAERAAEGGE